jgi:energy-coupling factor transporter ATP-binding protein EcfA2
LLQHIDSGGTIVRGKQHLSFGEKNAFSLVLFMFEALHKKPDLIVLDDPISSFDKNKKYAIINMLFGKDIGQLRKKTVLMLTHDLDPVIDTIKVLNTIFDNNICEANFINTKNGLLTEKRIIKQNLQSFAQICKSALDSNLDDIIKLIYLRRHFEIIDDLGDEYEILSNLFHKREKDKCQDHRVKNENEQYEIISQLNFNAWTAKIKNHIPSFDYLTKLTKLNNSQILKILYSEVESSYSKLNVFRLIYDERIEEIPNVLRKFINETFHIENELICQLNPNEYDIIPDFILQECDKYILE